MLLPQVIIVTDSYVVTFRLPYGKISIDHVDAIVLILKSSYTFVFVGVNKTKEIIVGEIVNYNQFEILKRLIQYGVNGFFEQISSIVSDHIDADQRTINHAGVL